jgi:hypothetical protein
MQQGDELRLSTEALRLQADELRNSVEQQRALVEVSRQQVESERANLEFVRHEREENAKPNFQATYSGGSFRGDGQTNYIIVISNSGNMATDYVADLIQPNGQTIRLRELPIYKKGQQDTVSFILGSPLEDPNYKLVITYRDALDRERRAEFAIQKVTAHPQSPLRFSRTTNV